MPLESVPVNLNGDFSIVPRDPNGVVPQLTILRATDDWVVDVQWNISGSLAEFIGASKTWTVTLLLESMGQGFEGPIASYTTSALGGLIQNYGPIPVSIPKNPMLADGNTSKIYKLVGVLTLADGATPLPVAGYAEGPMLQFYLP